MILNLKQRLALLFVLGVTAPPARAADFALAGVVRNHEGRPLAGATVSVRDTPLAARTDSAGGFRLSVPSGERELEASHPGYGKVTRRLGVDGDRSDLDFTLELLYRRSEEVVVQAIRADVETPVTKTDLGRAEVERLDYGQEMPFLLKDVPSVTQYSDTGIGAGYSYLYLRGIPQTRLNVTLDGVPLNEPEDSALYFVDFGDFASSLESIQVQRGVGTSSVGTASYAGSINFASVDLAERAQIAGRLGAGSFGTNRATLGAESGRFGPALRLYARGAYQETDGFRDHSGVIQKSLFYGASRQDDRSFLKVFGFVGREQTQLAFLATEKDVLERDLRFNPSSPEERDRFGQQFVQAQYTRFLGSTSSLAGQAYYNGAGGFYRIWADPEHASLYEYDLDWHVVGGLLTFRHVKGPLDFTAGAHVNGYESRHARDVVDVGPQYVNRGHKNEESGFAKLGYDVGRFHLYGDAQLRHARFRYEGDQPLGSIDWTFFNPRAGARFAADLHALLLRLPGPGRPRARARGHAFRRGQRHRALRPRGGGAGAGGGLRGGGGAAGTDLLPAGDRFRHGVPERDRADGRAVGDRPALAEERGQEPPPGPGAGRALAAPPGPGRPARRQREPQPHRPLDAVLRRVRRGRRLGGKHEPDLRRRSPPPDPRVRGQSQRGVRAHEVADPGRGGAVRGRRAPRQHRGRRLPHSRLLRTRCDARRSSLERWIRKGQPRLSVRVLNVLDNRRIWPSGYSYLFFTEDGAGALVPGGTAYYYPQATRSVFVALEFGR